MSAGDAGFTDVAVTESKVSKLIHLTTPAISPKSKLVEFWVAKLLILALNSPRPQERWGRKKYSAAKKKKKINN